MKFFTAYSVSILTVLLALLLNVAVAAQQVIEVGQQENGDKQTGFQYIWHDPSGISELSDAQQALRESRFAALLSKGSTGLQVGAFWSRFQLRNTSAQQTTIYLEYVDHQLIGLDAYQSTDNDEYIQIAQLRMGSSFDSRLIEHNRFVVPVTLAAHQQVSMLIKYSSEQSGFVFPSMRIWSEQQLLATHDIETSGMAFLFGGFFLMALFALVAGLASGERVFIAYGVYSFSKIVVWATILGYTHQYLLKAYFHWSMMSVSAAISIFCGLFFSRLFLQTYRYTPKLDWLLKAMMLNALVLAISAVAGFKSIAHISITLALLLYPILIWVSIKRWRQGSQDALIFASAWSVLVLTLVAQAMRDLGFVEHNFVNYFGPPLGSFVEMLVIMLALGLRVRRLRVDKELAEQNYRQHLEQSKVELQRQVKQRTQELEKAKAIAVKEANTDYLTGIYNRRCFLVEATKRLKLCQRKNQISSLLMFDLDHFKRINDRYGHLAGDQALKEFSENIIKRIRETDIFGRLGGEEFALLICEPPEQAVATAQRLCRDIGNMVVDKPDGQIKLTVSVGIAHSNEQSDLEQLMHAADQALYDAKHQGRNRVAIAN